MIKNFSIFYEFPAAIHLNTDIFSYSPISSDFSETRPPLLSLTSHPAYSMSSSHRFRLPKPLKRPCILSIAKFVLMKSNSI